MQTTKPVREFVYLGLALGMTGLTLLPFILFKATFFLPKGVGIHANTYKSICLFDIRPGTIGCQIVTKKRRRLTSRGRASPSRQ